MSATLEQSSPVALSLAEGDKLFPVPAALEKLTGQRPHPTTTCRYCLRGVAGVVLPSVVVSGKRMTTLSAAGEFLRAVTAAKNAAAV